MNKQGHRKIVIRTVDTGVLVFVASLYEELEHGIEEL